MKAIIIGSGISGLTAGAYLVDKGYEVRIYEQFEEIGGVTGELRQDGFIWNQGQMLVEGFSEGEQVGSILSDLSVTREIPLKRSDRIYSFPGFRIEKPVKYSGAKWRIEFLKTLFPEDSTGLDRYYKDYVKFMELVTLARKSERSGGVASRMYKMRMFMKLLPFLPYLKWNSQRFAERYFKNPELKAVFLSILADFVVRPSEFQGLGIFFVNPEPAFDRRIPLELSNIGRHPSYTYILGGCGVLVKCLEKKILEKGGRIVTGKAVQKINIKDGKAVGVVLDDENTESADVVIGSGGAREFVDLLDAENSPESLRKQVDDLPLMESVFMVNLGVDFDPRPYQGVATTYYYNTLDFEHGIDDIKKGKYHEGKEGFVIYIPSYHTPAMAPEGHHSLTIYTIAPNNPENGSWAERKEEMAEKLIIEAEKQIPGLRDHTVTKMIVTPDDFRKRTHLKHHAFGGVAPVMGKKGLSHKTPIKNLWYIGAQSESGAGMNNAMEGAWRTIKAMEKESR